MLRLFQESLIFGEAFSSQFSRVTTLTQQLCFPRNFIKYLAFLEQLFLQSSCFFEELLFQNSHFFAAVIFSEQLLFQSETSTKKPLLESRKIFRAFNFRNSYLFGGGTDTYRRDKDIYRRAKFSKQVLLHNIDFFRIVTFWRKLIFHKHNIKHYLLFLKSCLLKMAAFSKDVTF